MSCRRTGGRAVCGRSLAGVAGSNSTGDMYASLLRMKPVSGFWDGSIPRPEESYRVWCVCG